MPEHNLKNKTVNLLYGDRLTFRDGWEDKPYSESFADVKRAELREPAEATANLAMLSFNRPQQPLTHSIYPRR